MRVCVGERGVRREGLEERRELGKGLFMRRRAYFVLKSGLRRGLRQR